MRNSNRRSPTNMHFKQNTKQTPAVAYRSEIKRKAQQKIRNLILKKEASYTKIPKVTIQDLERICDLKPITNQPIHSLKYSPTQNAKPTEQENNTETEDCTQLWPIIQSSSRTFQQSKQIIINFTHCEENSTRCTTMQDSITQKHSTVIRNIYLKKMHIDLSPYLYNYI